MKRQTTKLTPTILALSLVLMAISSGIGVAQVADGGTSSTLSAAAEAPATTETTKGLLSRLSKFTELFPSGVIPVLTLSGAPDDVTLRQSELRRLLSAKETTFIYDPADRRDPMLLPWTHYRSAATKEVEAAEKAYGDKDLDLAERAFEEVLRTAARMEASAFQLKAMKGLIKRAELGLKNINDERDLEEQQYRIAQMEKGQLEPELPKWVRDNTIGVLFSTDHPMCLVGSEVLSVGEYVPFQAVNVRVEKIDKLSVTFYVSSLNNLSGKSFVVSLEEGE